MNGNDYYVLIGVGVGFAVFAKYGFLWALVYAVAWPAWIAYYVAERLLR